MRDPDIPIAVARMDAAALAALRAERFPWNEHIDVVGECEIVLRRPDETGVYVRRPNLVTNAGFDLLCDVLGLTAQPSELTHIAIGTGSTAAAAAQTSLVTEGGRAAAVYAHTDGTKVMTLTANIPAGTGTGNIREAGSFNAATGGTMFNRVVFASVNKGAADSLQVTFTFTFS